MLDGLLTRARAELEAAVTHAVATLQRVGDPRRLAGNPSELRRAAETERRRAAELRGVAALLDGRLRAVVPSRWVGRDGEACSAAWERLNAEAEACAAARDVVAATLEETAASAEALNERVADAASAVSHAVDEARRRLHDPSWLDAAALAGLLQRLLLLSRTLEQGAQDAERFAAGLARRLPGPETHVRFQVGVVPLITPGRLGIVPGWAVEAPGRAGVLPSAGIGAGGARGGGAGLVLVGLGMLLALLAALASQQGGGGTGGGGDTTGGGGSTSVAGAPQPGPPEGPPRKPNGEIDWAAWRARLASKGIRGDLDARIADAMKGRAGAIEELRTAE
jgi:uncharacterized protein YukE